MAVLSSGKMLSSWTIGSCEMPAGVDFSIERDVEEKRLYMIHISFALGIDCFGSEGYFFSRFSSLEIGSFFSRVTPCDSHSPA